MLLIFVAALCLYILYRIGWLRQQITHLKNDITSLNQRISFLESFPDRKTHETLPVMIEEAIPGFTETYSPETGTAAQLVEPSPVTPTPPPLETAPASMEEAPSRVYSGEALNYEDFSPYPETPPEPRHEAALSLWNSLCSFFRAGYSWVTVGVGVLLVGLAFFIQYVAQRRVFERLFPVELRLTLIALCGIALTLFGWRLRTKKETYALILQAGGVGVLYLTVFATLKLTTLLPAWAVFLLLSIIVFLTSALALLQNSQPFACMALLGGFAAPILVSSGAGNYIALFAFYSLLNLGILWIAYARNWQGLSLIGFTSTYLVAFFWGHSSYAPDKFIASEFFLILFFLIYSGISVLNFLKSEQKEKARFTEIGLALVNPFVFCAIQAYLTKDFTYGLSISAFSVGAFYILSGRALWRLTQEKGRHVIEILLLTGVVFCNLAVPLALSGRWTSALWAVEGMILYIIGLRLQRPAFLRLGVALQFIGGFFLLGTSSNPSIPLTNTQFIGRMLVAICALVSVLITKVKDTNTAAEDAPFSRWNLIWGLLWWYGALFGEIVIFASSANHAPLILLVSCLSAAFFFLLAKYFHCDDLNYNALMPMGAVIYVTLRNVAQTFFLPTSLFDIASFIVSPSPLQGWGFLSWTVFFVTIYGLFFLLREYFGIRLIRAIYLITFIWWFSILARCIAIVSPQEDWGSLMLLLTSLNALFFFILARYLHCSALSAAALFPFLLIGINALKNLVFLTDISLLTQMLLGAHPLYRWGIIAWPVFFLIHYTLLFRLHTFFPRTVLAWGHRLAFLLAVLLMQVEVHYWVHKLPSLGTGISLWWGSLIILLVLPCLIYSLFRYWENLPACFHEWKRVYLIDGCGTICCVLAAWFILTLFRKGYATPLLYIPFFNPLDMALALCLGCCVLWVRAVQNPMDDFDLKINLQAWQKPFYIAIFAWNNAILMRTVFHYSISKSLLLPHVSGFFGDSLLPLGLLWDSPLWQTSTTLLWAVWGSGLMFTGCKVLINRSVWIAGSTLLAVDTVKIFLVDLSQTNTLTRISSFIATGIVLILIGYYAPLPPRTIPHHPTTEDSNDHA